MKVKPSRYRPGVAQRVGRGIALPFHDRATRKGWVVSSKPRPHFTPRKTRYPFYRRLGGPQGRSGRAENLVPTGIWSRTVQPVVSRYTDWASGPTHIYIYTHIIFLPTCFGCRSPSSGSHLKLIWLKNLMKPLYVYKLKWRNLVEACKIQ